MKHSRPSKRILPIIVFAQFCCTSLWFGGNSIIQELTLAFSLPDGVLSYFTSIIQLGFIVGTLVFAILTIADRFPPSKVFFVCAIAGSIANLGLVLSNNCFESLLLLRFLTGFFLAGIYPVGMKIAADYYQKGLGKSLGWLVGALVLGTAFPHLVKAFATVWNWTFVIYTISVLAALGGVLMILLVPVGPFRKVSQQPDFTTFFTVFRHHKFRKAAFGYFGHMWELYAFWTFVPMMLLQHFNNSSSVSFYAFLIIAIGGLGCVISGYLAQKIGAKKVATIALTASGISCLLSPLVLVYGNALVVMMFLLFWGFMVVADSPLFSTLVAQNVPIENKGTALTVVNCIGFSLTIISIQSISFLLKFIDPNMVFLFLVIGPIFGLAAIHAKPS